MKNFTLIELLVVVAIIGILTSILLPSLSQARVKSKLAVCKSLLSQNAKSVLTYTISNDDNYPFLTIVADRWAVATGTVRDDRPLLESVLTNLDQTLKCPLNDQPSITNSTVTKGTFGSYDVYFGTVLNGTGTEMFSCRKAYFLLTFLRQRSMGIFIKRALSKRSFQGLQNREVHGNKMFSKYHVLGGPLSGSAFHVHFVREDHY